VVTDFQVLFVVTLIGWILGILTDRLMLASAAKHRERYNPRDRRGW
jgi:hypothetical protein